MKTMLGLAVVFFTVTMVASAQRDQQVIDSVMFSSSAPGERPVNRPFGFSPYFSDSIDYALPSSIRERELPGFPPQSFYVLFEQGFQGPLTDRDIRGVPDSVGIGKLQRFSLNYDLSIQLLDTEHVTVHFPRGMGVGIDSVIVRDILGGTGLLFSRTFKGSEPDSFLIANNAITHIKMVVYYDLTNVPMGIAERAQNVARLGLYPNPVRRGQTVTLGNGLRGDGEVTVSNLLGETLVRRFIERGNQSVKLDLSEMRAGTYFVRHLDRTGNVMAQELVNFVP